jgi:hypothetical protein
MLCTVVRKCYQDHPKAPRHDKARQGKTKQEELCKKGGHLFRHLFGLPETLTRILWYKEKENTLKWFLPVILVLHNDT